MSLLIFKFPFHVIFSVAMQSEITDGKVLVKFKKNNKNKIYT